MLDLHAINSEITFLYSMESIAAVDSFMIHTCKYSTAMRRKTWSNYRDPVSGWSKTTKGNIHDSRVSHDMVDSVRYFSYILADSAYDTTDIYDYVFENTHALPVIDTNRRRGIVSHKLSVNRKIDIDLRREIERTFSILEEIMNAENICYTGNRDCDTAMGLKAIAYNFMVISSMEVGGKPR